MGENSGRFRVAIYFTKQKPTTYPCRRCAKYNMVLLLFLSQF